MQELTEFQIGRIAKKILLKRMKELDIKAEFENADVAAFEKYVKLYLSIVDDFRKNFDADIARIDKMKKQVKLG